MMHERPGVAATDIVTTDESPAPSSESSSRHIGWDYSLMLATIALLGFLGLQSLVGTLYTWWAYRSIPGWEQTGSEGFIQAMNAVAAPVVIALVVVMGLCVPKRLFARRMLVAVSVGMLAIGAATAAIAGSLATGLAIYLALSGLIQVAVVVLTLAGSGGLAYITEGRFAKAGSGLLHLGFILFALVIVALQASPMMMPAFMLSGVLLTGGSAMSFYARRTQR